MIPLVIAFVVLEAIDAFLTLWAMRQGGFTELNPWLAPVAASWWMPAIKILPAIAAAAIIIMVVSRWPRLQWIANTGITVVCCFLALVIVSNIFEVIGRR